MFLWPAVAGVPESQLDAFAIFLQSQACLQSAPQLRMYNRPMACETEDIQYKKWMYTLKKTHEEELSHWQRQTLFGVYMYGSTLLKTLGISSKVSLLMTCTIHTGRGENILGTSRMFLGTWNTSLEMRIDKKNRLSVIIRNHLRIWTNFEFKVCIY